ncbi:MAG TPA: aspartate--tRNA ligase [Vicinamibacterales bacterium]|nr:aspartate--tRNA ligase [Vicinamibacterales bacterium]
MAEQLGSLARTHTCGALRSADVDRDVVLLGWVHRVRDLGSLVFIDVRDRHGITQVIIEGHEALLERSKRLRSEYVVGVLGKVERRSPDTVNLNVPTGEVEVRAAEIRVLNEAKTPPFSIAEDMNVSEETRLRYRYLDLRRPQLQRNIGLRHRITMAIRKYFDEQGFYEIETPILTKSTPEGARDFLVPSRVHPGEFYALPQSPQIFKQILMIAGFDRYVQIARCFRDEALRADRQLEFTQVDLEISFATPPLVFEIVEGALAACFREIGVEIKRPFRRMPYAEAIAKYGSDKPDLRFGLEIQDFGAAFAQSPFGIFREAVEHGGTVRGFVIPGAGGYSRRELDNLVDQAKQLGAGGLVYARVRGDGVQVSAKDVGEETTRQLLAQAGAGVSDLLVLASGAPDAVSKVLGQLRLQVAKQANLIPDGAWELTWVTDFPLFDWNADEKRWDSVNHPFTAPREEDLHLLESDPGRVLAKAYDVILNGWELGGGSIRIHDRETQATVFRLLGLSDEDAKHRFGFFLESLEYGTPPHGGLALGLDRICALLAGESSIREVIPFPKTTQAVDLMCDAPSTVDPRQLRELSIKVTG